VEAPAPPAAGRASVDGEARGHPPVVGEAGGRDAQAQERRRGLLVSSPPCVGAPRYVAWGAARPEQPGRVAGVPPPPPPDASSLKIDARAAAVAIASSSSPAAAAGSWSAGGAAARRPRPRSPAGGSPGPG
ncbi:hypothetical protein THAOC_09057, partial [Thalassiosira oceanica]